MVISQFGTLVFFVYLTCITSTPSRDVYSCNGTTNYERQKDISSNLLKRARLSSIVNGHYSYLLQTYASLTDRSKDCSVVTKEGVIRAYAIKYAVDDVNKNILKQGKLGIQIDDVCDDLPTTMARGIEGISFHRPNSVCRVGFLKCDTSIHDNTIIRKSTAVIGSGLSFTTVPLASLTSLYDIPHIGFSSTTEALNDREIYNSFFRTVPSDKYQVEVFLSIFAKFKWNYIFLVGSDDDYGRPAIEDLKEKAEKLLGYNKVCIVGEEYIPYQSPSKTDSTIADTIKKIKGQKKANVVVLFTYVKGLGEQILTEAKKQNVSRLWLTSEAWNPDALDLPTDLKDQAHGIISVSIKSRQLNKLTTYIRQEIQTNWNCSLWLKNYLQNNISPYDELNYDETTETFHFTKGNKTNYFSITLNKLMKTFEQLPAQTENMIDGIRAIANGLRYAQEELCKINNQCNGTAQPKQITDQIYKQTYVNENGVISSFKTDGTPNNVIYSIENLIWNENSSSYQYINIGTWHNLSNTKLIIQPRKIQWPYWFQTKGINPNIDEEITKISVCEPDCKPGQYFVNKVDCCWECKECKEKTVTTTKMQSSCTPCNIYQHANTNKSKCLQSPQQWLNIKDAEGIAIISVSSCGFILIIAATVYLFRSRQMVCYGEEAPHLIVVSCLLVIITFAYGAMFVMKPGVALCPVRNSMFYLLLMMYAALLLIKTKFMTNLFIRNSDEAMGDKLSTAQLLFLLMLFLLELVSVVVWLYIDKDDIDIDRLTRETILLQCTVKFTATKLVSIFIPCIILVIATFFAFRERNGEHYFYEPKFLSFTCIALCIIIIAFLPTFKYVVGTYTAFVMVFTIDVFGYTYISCVIFPKVYVTFVRNKNGEETFKLKPAQEKEKKVKPKKKKNKTKESLSETTVSTDAGSSIKKVNERKSESSKSKKESVVTKVDISNMSENYYSTIGEKEVIKFDNPTYEEIDVNQVKKEKDEKYEELNIKLDAMDDDKNVEEDEDSSMGVVNNSYVNTEAMNSGQKQECSPPMSPSAVVIDTNK